MRYIIVIKGDGRGHITQALSLMQLLRAARHEVACLVVCCPPTTVLPPFLYEKSPVPIVRVYSFNFATDSKARGISWRRTILRGAFDLPAVHKGLRHIGLTLREHQPDVIVNLYDAMMPLYALQFGVKVPIIHISHQALMMHEGFTFPPGRRAERAVVLNWTRFTRLKSVKSLALSFYELPDDAANHIYPVPPLLREEVVRRTPTEGSHILSYLLNHGLAADLQAYNKKRPDREIHAFWNKTTAPPELRYSDTLTFHRLNDELFLDYMASCQGVASTAGFETVCEAFYYGKPAILMPTPRQYEQYVNAFDAERVGAGKMVSRLDMNALDAFLPSYSPNHAAYLNWLVEGKEKLLYHLENPLAMPLPARPVSIGQ